MRAELSRLAVDRADVRALMRELMRMRALGEAPPPPPPPPPVILSFGSMDGVPALRRMPD